MTISIARHYWLLLTKPNEVIYDLDTRWDMEKQYWGNLWFKLWTSPWGHFWCKRGRHDDFVVVANRQAVCIWCRRRTDILPKWYLNGD